MAIFMGVDPGQSGAIAWIDETGRNYEAWKLRDRTIREICDAMATDLVDFAYVERVSAMPKQGVSSTFKFGENYGILQACLVADNIPFERVTPAKWQAALNCRSGGNKNITKQRAAELFPDVKVTHAIADALLIAEYCRRQRLAIEGKRTDEVLRLNGG